MDTAPAARSDVYQSVTDRIIAAIEAGAGESIMPWHGGKTSRPRNALTGNDYHGVNILALWAAAHLHGFETSWWGTYKQWQDAGAQVRRSERA